MKNENKPKHFKLPQSLLTQLNECSLGYHLVIVNDRHDFETFVSYPDAVTEMALINYIDIQTSAIQDRIRAQASFGDEEEEE